ncbi:protein YgfX [Pseudomonas sp. NPDC007930]|uniref:protein YgfX n=1 Tax=Pseudomonas sp. NPDC007930 TaxID=3364417 RepID=UPI0036E0C8D1
MSNPSNPFECRWGPSPWLQRGFAGVAFCSLLAAFALALPAWPRLLVVLALLAAVAWVLPRQLWLSHPAAVTGLRREGERWWLFSRARGWHLAQLRPDTVVMPGLVILRYRLPGQWWVRSQCVPADAMAAEAHRRLRVRLGFSRRRFSQV